MMIGPSNPKIEVVNELCCAIGHVVVQWGFVEHNLYICVAYIYDKYGGKEIAEIKELSIFVNRQKTFLRKCFNKIDSLVPFKKEGLSLLHKIAILSKERDSIIHSTYAGLWDDSFKFYEFSIKDYEVIYVKKLKRDINSILETRKKIQDLAADLGHFVLRLSGK